MRLIDADALVRNLESAFFGNHTDDFLMAMRIIDQLPKYDLPCRLKADQEVDKNIQKYYEGVVADWNECLDYILGRASNLREEDAL